ncbi:MULTISPECIES: hypothetical protein [Bacillus cereus group]|uniref:hypothetical protein n=1 Tax=Bacillus cereus group TaxID=86661 RepID=UPI0007B6EB56|nr:hypothetical protein [Bacillus cereus]ANC07811.1 hypothetical protein WR47_12135 [Bacillus cereus]ANC13633.1 hypothetical protein WR51_12145 [Bacillus cereus]MDA1995288.1 hypothetical protein [Bacillus cereus]MDA2001304.1 hypothetical protein [Bacillus cereus]MDA3655098.1 hypothetical protein [Bacillus cereus]
MSELITSLKDELENPKTFLNGSCDNRTNQFIPIYATPNYKNDNFHNSLYGLPPGKKTRSDIDFDGIYIPEGFKAKLTGGRIFEGPIAIKYNDLKHVIVTNYENLTWTIPNAPNAIFPASASSCDGGSGHLCWPIPKNFDAFEAYGPKNVPTE